MDRPEQPETHAAATPRVPWRFSIADLLFGMLGVAVALGVWRITGVSWAVLLLCSFAVWFAVGAWSQALAIRRTLKTRTDFDPLVRHALVRALLARMIAPIAIGGAAVLFIGDELRWESLKTSAWEYGYYGVMETLTMALLVLPILSLCNPSESNPIQRGGSWHIIVQSIAAIVGLVLAIVVVCDMLLIPLLVHIAIEGVLQALPWRRRAVVTGMPPVDHYTRQLFAYGAIAATALWFVAAAFIRRLSGISLDSSWGRRLVYLAMATSCGLLVCLTAWGGTTFYKRISPVIGETPNERPPASLPIAVVVVACTVFWATQLFLVPSSAVQAVTVRLDAMPRRFLHEWWLVLCLPIVWWLHRLIDLYQQLWEFMFDRGNFDLRDVVMYFQNRVNWLGMALLLALLTIGWRRWKRRDEPGVIVVTPVPTITWAATALGATVLAVTAPPILAWLGFVLWTWPDQFPGEAWLLLRK